MKHRTLHRNIRYCAWALGLALVLAAVAFALRAG